VKEVSQLLKENYKEMVRVKKHVEEELERNDELNNNIIEENDFSNRDHLPHKAALLDLE
jgi:predicted phage-related endonuclease